MGSTKDLGPGAEGPGNIDLTQDDDQKWSPVAENWPVAPDGSAKDQDTPETEAAEATKGSDEARQDEGFITLDNPDPKPN